MLTGEEIQIMQMALHGSNLTSEVFSRKDGKVGLHLKLDMKEGDVNYKKTVEENLKSALIECARRVPPEIMRKFHECSIALGIQGTGLMIGSARRIEGLNFHRLHIAKEIKLRQLKAQVPFAVQGKEEVRD